VEDEKIQEIKCNIKEEKPLGFLEDDEGVLWYKGMICVPDVKEFDDKILHTMISRREFNDKIRWCTMISRPVIGIMV
jgi:hypothetical protein